MRKGILSLLLVVGLAGVALAVPDGPGGTFYFKSASVGQVNQKDGTQHIWYLNMNSD